MNLLGGARKFSFPEGLLDGEHDAVVLCIPVPLVPYFRRFFSQVQSPYIWKTPDDYQRAYPVFAAIEVQMAATSCVSDITESINRLYRLVDTIFNGAQYAAFGEPPVISPAIPSVPDVNDFDQPGLRKQLLDMQGIINAGWFGIGGRPATLADLAEAMKGANNADKDRVLGLLDALNATSSAATIFNTVKDLFMSGEELITDGAVLGTLIASTVANAALMGAQAAQLDDLIEKMDRLIISLDGGGEAPAANVVDELGEIRTLLG